MKFNLFLQKWKYELLLFALAQHLFIGIFLRDLPFYTTVIWPINMLILGPASVGIFMDKGKWKNRIRWVLFLLVLALPIGLPFFRNMPDYYIYLNLTYVAFFSFILWELMRFLIKPGYINVDIIVASACGYFLFIEIATFLFQFFYYQDPNCFKGIDAYNPATVYMDLVYFSSITLTSIGYGDILPHAHHTKLIASVFGIAGQFYSVVLVGILISKFVSKSEK